MQLRERANAEYLEKAATFQQSRISLSERDDNDMQGAIDLLSETLESYKATLKNDEQERESSHHSLVAAEEKLTKKERTYSACTGERDLLLTTLNTKNSQLSDARLRQLKAEFVSNVDGRLQEVKDETEQSRTECDRQRETVKRLEGRIAETRKNIDKTTVDLDLAQNRREYWIRYDTVVRQEALIRALHLRVHNVDACEQKSQQR